MTRLTYAAYLISEDEPVPETLLPCSKCRWRHHPADELFDARSYPDLSGDWLCHICLSEKDREELVAAEVADDTCSWSPDDERANAVRAERQRLLSLCDWTQGQDSPLDSTAIAAWALYRAALRDLPQDYADPSLVVWPLNPEEAL